MLSQDPFGNYVVQYVLELGHPETSAMVMTNLKGHYGELATQKFRWGLWGGLWMAQSRPKAAHALPERAGQRMRGCLLPQTCCCCCTAPATWRRRKCLKLSCRAVCPLPAPHQRSATPPNPNPAAPTWWRSA